MQGAQNRRPPMEKRQHQNARGKKLKTSDEKRGNTKTQGAQNKTPLMKKEATPTYKEIESDSEGDAFQFHTKRQVTVNHTKAISQTENQELLVH
jgi:hypothetical protein